MRSVCSADSAGFATSSFARTVARTAASTRGVALRRAPPSRIACGELALVARTRPRPARRRARARCSRACSSSRRTIPSARSDDAQLEGGAPLELRQHVLAERAAGRLEQLERGRAVVQGGRRDGAWRRAAEPARGPRSARRAAGRAARAGPTRPRTRGGRSRRARPSAVAPDRWVKACITQITPQRSVPASSHQAQRRRIDGDAGVALVGLEQLLARAEPRGGTVRPREAPRRHAQPAEILDGVAGVGELPVEHAGQAARARPSGCPCGSRRARACAAPAAGRSLPSARKASSNAGCGSPRRSCHSRSSASGSSIAGRRVARSAGDAVDRRERGRRARRSAARGPGTPSPARIAFGSVVPASASTHRPARCRASSSSGPVGDDGRHRHAGRGGRPQQRGLGGALTTLSPCRARSARRARRARRSRTGRSRARPRCSAAAARPASGSAEHPPQAPRDRPPALLARLPRRSASGGGL